MGTSTKLRIRKFNPADRFTMLPNDFVRFGGRTKLSLRGRALLAALVSYSDGWELDRSVIDAIAHDLGRDAIDTVRDELKRKGHLRTEKERMEDGTFAWTWFVSVEPFRDGQDGPQPPPEDPLEPQPGQPEDDVFAQVKPSPDYQGTETRQDHKPLPENPGTAPPAETEFSQVAPYPDQPSTDKPCNIEEQVLEKQEDQKPASQGLDLHSPAQAAPADPDLEETAKSILKTVSAGLGDRKPAGSLAFALVTDVTNALQRGWPAWRITHLLGNNTQEAVSVGKYWRTLIKNHFSESPQATAPTSPATPTGTHPQYPALNPGERSDVHWCRACRDPQTRVVVPDYGKPYPCQDCHPDRLRTLAEVSGAC